MTRIARYTLWAITLLVMINVSGLDIYHDEVYYWTWSRHLALSYYDHPPLIAYGMRLFTSVFGNHLLAIRLFGILCWSGSAYILYQLALDIFKRPRIAEISLLLYILMPITQLEMRICIPDAPQAFFWTLTLYALNKIFLQKNRHWVCGLGLSAGGLLLSKYTGILLAPTALIFIWQHDKSSLKQPWPYLAALIALALFSPVIIWNIQHSGASFLFQLSHGAGIASTNFQSRTHVLPLLVGASSMLGIFASITLLCTVYQLHSTLWKDPRFALLFWPMAIDLLVHFLLAVHTLQFPRWMQPALISATIIMAYAIDQFGWKKIYYLINGNNILHGVLSYGLAVFGNNASHQAWQWYSRITPFIQDIQKFKLVEYYKPAYLFSDEWWKAATTTYTLKGHPKVCLLPGARRSEYDRWCVSETQQLKAHHIPNALYIGNETNLKRLWPYFDQCKPLLVKNIAFTVNYPDPIFRKSKEISGYYRAFYCWNGAYRDDIPKPKFYGGIWLK